MNRCKQCNNPMTWAQSRVQFGRLLKQGKTPEQAKEILPRCQLCVTRLVQRTELDAKRAAERIERVKRFIERSQQTKRKRKPINTKQEFGK